MDDYRLSEINIFPVKSLQQVSLSSSQVLEMGLKNDRRWMIVNEKGEYQSLKRVDELARFLVDIRNNRNLIISHPESPDSLTVPLEIRDGKNIQVKIMGDTCDALLGSEDIDAWFSRILNREVHLVYLPEESLRNVNPQYAQNDEKVGFSNGYPLMMIGQASLDDLNTKLDVKVTMERFRPNLVFTGGSPFEEDEFSEFEIGQCYFKAVKPCPRCVVINVEPETGIRGTEPLKTLSSYRLSGNDINMGQNMLCLKEGTIEIGQPLTVTTRKS